METLKVIPLKKLHELMLEENELIQLKEIIDDIATNYNAEILNHFIAKSAEKLMRIYKYYAAFYGFTHFPYKNCDAA
jgi:hypothetical protein